MKKHGKERMYFGGEIDSNMAELRETIIIRKLHIDNITTKTKQLGRRDHLKPQYCTRKALWG